MNLQQIENLYQFKFPPDLLELYKSGSFDSEKLSDLTKVSDEKLRYLFEAPYKGLLLDIELNDLWLDVWGKKPGSLNERLSVFNVIYKNAPVLIPLMSEGHKYISSLPMQSDNPIYSVMQSDIICVSLNLRFYIGGPENKILDQDLSIPKIPFWNEFL